MKGGQALVELALCAPVAVLLGLGAAAAVQVADAQAGLNAAAQAAAAAAARAPDATTAERAAQASFAGVVAAYPVRGPSLSLNLSAFDRGGRVSASAAGYVDIAWAGLVFDRRNAELHASAGAEVEPWRSRP